MVARSRQSSQMQHRKRIWLSNFDHPFNLEEDTFSEKGNGYLSRNGALSRSQRPARKGPNTKARPSVRILAPIGHQKTSQPLTTQKMTVTIDVEGLLESSRHLSEFTNRTLTRNHYCTRRLHRKRRSSQNPPVPVE